jgi:hypothetical protein
MEMKSQSSFIFILLNLVLLSIVASCSDLMANDIMIDPWTDTSGFLFPENEPSDRLHNASDAIALENQSIMAPLITPCIPIPEMDWNVTFGGNKSDIGYSVQMTKEGGYIIVGKTDILYPFQGDVRLVKTDSAGNKLWDKTFGGKGEERGYCVQETIDGGYIISGFTNSFGAGRFDIWLIKTDSMGNKLWDKTFGGKDDDFGYSVQETMDGGYIIAGSTRSYGKGGFDIWLIKTDSMGNKLWDKTLGGSGYDFSYSVQETIDGDYVIAGSTASYGAGGFDIWLIKTDSAGNKLWDKTFGGKGEERGYCFQETIEGDYVIVGSTNSFGAGGYDVWLVKTDYLGNEDWDITFGEAKNDFGYFVQETIDGGYIIAGSTTSHGAGGADIWLVKVGYEGDVIWNSKIGGVEDDVAFSVQPTSDGGYILAGWTSSFGAGNSDAWLVKTNSAGGEVWNATFGGAGEDWAVSAWPTPDGSYILAGGTDSFGGGGFYAWLIKTDNVGHELWNKTLGNADNDSIASVELASDGGYILAGKTMNFWAGDSDAWLVKTNASGCELWNTKFGGKGDDFAESVKLDYDGGYVLTGGSDSFGSGDVDAWLIKTNSSGREIWNATFGGGVDGFAHSVQVAPDNGYILAGEVDYGLIDAWLIKSDSAGGEVWNRTIRGD